jgi:type IV secretory pathway VirB6-like protein
LIKSFLPIQFKTLRAFLGKLFVLSLLLFSYSSCTDQGCIEADDFGEYEQEVLTVKANNLGGTCDYFASKSVGDAEQGSGLKNCLNQGTTTIQDETGTEQVGESGKGCSGFASSATNRQICIDDCIQKCRGSSQSASASAEPNWVSTHKKEPGRNIGVTISPGSEVSIRAIGTIVLGGYEPDPVYTRAEYSGLQVTKSDLSSNAFIDLQAGEFRTVEFSGKWDGDVNGSNGIDFGGNPSDPATFNGARRLAAVLIPHPIGYNFNVKAASESAGNDGVPLFADTSLWRCDGYIKDNLELQPDCYSGSEIVPNANSSPTDEYYQISSDSDAIFPNREDSLGSFGGMLRWDGDGLLPLSTDDTTSIANQDTREIPSNPHATRLLLKSTSDCPLRFSINKGVSVEVSVKKSFSETTPYISIETGQTIVLDNSKNADCPNFDYQILKLHDIKIKKSGFVSFTNVGNVNANVGDGGNCSLKGRIINPLNIKGELNDYTDFYEYDNFDVINSIDPISDLSVPVSSQGSGTPFAMSQQWSAKVYVRKGQVIRLDPESWDGNWVAQNTSLGTLRTLRTCGIGMAIRVGGFSPSGSVEDRPAFLCYGKNSEDVPNPDCIVGVDSGTGEQNCQEISQACFDSNNADQYCPDKTCQIETPAEGCEFPDKKIFVRTCKACHDAKVSAGNEKLTIQITADQCYNLENYTGKVSDIYETADSNGIITSDAEKDAVDAVFAKGAEKLADFNGYYGNFESFSYAGESSGSNYVYTLKKLIYPYEGGRLMFLIVDNDDFTTDFEKDFNPETDVTGGNYENNSPSGNSYTGSNGYRIDMSGQQSFKNGQWLQVTLCAETGTANSPVCSDDNAEPVSGQPNVVTIANPTAIDPGPSINSYYKFDEFGSLVRFNNSGSTDPTNPNIAGLYQTTAGDFFYRHGYEGFDATAGADNSEAKKIERISNLRLSFKIKDSDIGNCDIDAPTLNQDCSSGSGTTCDGLVSQNPFYEKNRPQIDGNSELAIETQLAVSGHDGEICPGTLIGPVSEDDCQKQFFCANLYHNNDGEYQVVVKVKNEKTNISGLVDQVISPVLKIMDGDPEIGTVGQAERVYTAVVSDSRFQTIISICFIVMITFYGLGYLMGVSEFSQAEILSRIIKVGIIYLFIGPYGWHWFDMIFVDMFKSGTDYITFLMASAFDRSSDLQNAIALNDFSDKAILFGGIDEVFGMFFSSAVQSKIWALFFASIFGPIYLFIIYLGFMLYVFAVANAVLLYLTAQIFISILFILGPIFFIMLMFNQTKSMFDKWLGELIGFSLQQIFLLTTLAFFNMMMYEVVKISLGYRICWEDVWVLDLGITRIKLLSFWTVSSMPQSFNAQSDVGNIGNPEGIPSLFSILFIWVIASLMSKFIEFMTDLGATIGGSVRAAQLAGAIKGDAGALAKGAKSYVASTFVGKGVSGAIASVDRAAFNSGKKADEDRATKLKESNGDVKSTSSLRKAREKSDKEFNSNKLNFVDANGIKKSNVEAHRKAAGDSAVDSKAKDMGLSDDKKNTLLGKNKLRNEDGTLKKDASGKQEWSEKGSHSKLAAAIKSETVGGALMAAKRSRDMNKNNKDRSNNVSLATLGKMSDGATDEQKKALKNMQGKGKGKDFKMKTNFRERTYEKTKNAIGLSNENMKNDSVARIAAKAAMIPVTGVVAGIGFGAKEAGKSSLGNIRKAGNFADKKASIAGATLGKAGLSVGAAALKGKENLKYIGRAAVTAAKIKSGYSKREDALEEEGATKLESVDRTNNQLRAMDRWKDSIDQGVTDKKDKYTENKDKNSAGKAEDDMNIIMKPDTKTKDPDSSI